MKSDDIEKPPPSLIKKVPVSRLHQLSTPKHRKNVSGAISFAQFFQNNNSNSIPITTTTSSGTTKSSTTNFKSGSNNTAAITAPTTKQINSQESEIEVQNNNYNPRTEKSASNDGNQKQVPKKSLSGSNPRSLWKIPDHFQNEVGVAQSSEGENGKQGNVSQSQQSTKKIANYPKRDSFTAARSHAIRDMIKNFGSEATKPVLISSPTQTPPTVSSQPVSITPARVNDLSIPKYKAVKVFSTKDREKEKEGLASQTPNDSLPKESNVKEFEEKKKIEILQNSSNISISNKELSKNRSRLGVYEKLKARCVPVPSPTQEYSQNEKNQSQISQLQLIPQDVNKSLTKTSEFNSPNKTTNGNGNGNSRSINNNSNNNGKNINHSNGSKLYQSKVKGKVLSSESSHQKNTIENENNSSQATVMKLVNSSNSSSPTRQGLQKKNYEASEMLSSSTTSGGGSGGGGGAASGASRDSNLHQQVTYSSSSSTSPITVSSMLNSNDQPKKNSPLPSSTSSSSAPSTKLSNFMKSSNQPPERNGSTTTSVKSSQMKTNFHSDISERISSQQQSQQPHQQQHSDIHKSANGSSPPPQSSSSSSEMTYSNFQPQRGSDNSMNAKYLSQYSINEMKTSGSSSMPSNLTINTSSSSSSLFGGNEPTMPGPDRGYCQQYEHGETSETSATTPSIYHGGNSLSESKTHSSSPSHQSNYLTKLDQDSRNLEEKSSSPRFPTFQSNSFSYSSSSSTAAERSLFGEKSSTLNNQNLSDQSVASHAVGKSSFLPGFPSHEFNDPLTLKSRNNATDSESSQISPFSLHHPLAPWNQNRPSSSPLFNSSNNNGNNGNNTGSSAIPSNMKQSMTESTLLTQNSAITTIEKNLLPTKLTSSSNSGAGETDLDDIDEKQSAAAIQLRNARRRFRQSSQIALTRKWPIRGTPLVKLPDEVSPRYKSPRPTSATSTPPETSNLSQESSQRSESRSPQPQLHPQSQVQSNSSTSKKIKKEAIRQPMKSCLKKTRQKLLTLSGLSMIRRVKFDQNIRVEYFDPDLSEDSSTGSSADGDQTTGEKIFRPSIPKVKINVTIPSGSGSGSGSGSSSYQPRNIEEALEQSRKERERLHNNDGDLSSSDSEEETADEILNFSKERFTVSDLMSLTSH